MYVELHAHSAFSYLDGASLPDELAAAAADYGYSAMALTDHNGVSGSMEFAQAASALGVRAIHGTEVDLADGRHITLLVETEQGWRNLCQLLTRAHAHTRGTVDESAEDRAARQEGHGRHQSLVGTRMRRVDVPPQLPLATIAEYAAGLICLSGCATRGVHDEPGLRELLAVFGPDRLRVELQRPFQRDDRARNRALADLAARLKVATVATGNVHAHARERGPLQDAFVALRNHTTLDASEPLRRGNFSHVLAPPEAMAARFPEYPEAVAETERLAARLKFDLRSDLGYRYPGSEDEEALGKLAELCWARLRGALPRGLAARGGGARPARAGAAGDRPARPGRLLPAPPRPARARARGGGAGARPVIGARAAAARSRARVVGVLDRLLPHRPLAHRPGDQRAVPRPLPQRGADRAAGHRSGLPARHPRGPDPARARALRARALGAGRRVPDVPVARRDPRARQGARPRAG